MAVFLSLTANEYACICKFVCVFVYERSNRLRSCVARARRINTDWPIDEWEKKQQQLNCSTRYTYKCIAYHGLSDRDIYIGALKVMFGCVKEIAILFSFVPLLTKTTIFENQRSEQTFITAIHICVIWQIDLLDVVNQYVKNLVEFWYVS